MRELEHLVERLVVLGRAAEVDASELPRTVREPDGGHGPTFNGQIIPVRELEHRYAAWALEQVGGHRGRAAEKLGIDEKTLWRWLGERQAEAK